MPAFAGMTGYPSKVLLHRHLKKDAAILRDDIINEKVKQLADLLGVAFSRGAEVFMQACATFICLALPPATPPSTAQTHPTSEPEPLPHETGLAPAAHHAKAAAFR